MQDPVVFTDLKKLEHPQGLVETLESYARISNWEKEKSENISPTISESD